jgi:dTMP kinase
MPSLTLYMRLPVKVAMARGKERRESDRIEAEWLAFHQRVAEGYEAIADANPDRVVPVPAGMQPWQVTEFCIDVIKERYGQLFAG